MKKIWLFSILIVAALYLMQCSPKIKKQLSSPAPISKSQAVTPLSDADMQMESVVEGLATADIIQNDDGTTSPAPLIEIEETTGIDVGHGKQIWATSCKKCHALYVPSTRTAAQWEEILVVMADKAQLSPDDKAGVAAYLRSYSKK